MRGSDRGRTCCAASCIFEVAATGSSRRQSPGGGKGVNSAFRKWRKGSADLAGEVDVGVVVPDEDVAEERVLAEARDDHDDVLRSLPVQDDPRHVPLNLVQQFGRRIDPGDPKSFLGSESSDGMRRLPRDGREDVERTAAFYAYLDRGRPRVACEGDGFPDPEGEEEEDGEVAEAAELEELLGVVDGEAAADWARRAPASSAVVRVGVPAFGGSLWFEDP